jgi:predicted restriction endonuclease
MDKHLTHKSLDRLWKEVVSRRHNYRCAICKSKIIDVHHIVGRYAFVRFDPENGICLCRKHHNQVHEAKIDLVESKHIPIDVYERLIYIALRGEHLTIEDREHFYDVLTRERDFLIREDPWETI